MQQLTKDSVCRHKIPILFREPYVLRGYRQVDKPWFYYISSIFKLHNESVNIWSHILASLLVIQKFSYFVKELDFINDPLTWPLLAGVLSSIAVFSLSCSAHCLQSKSYIVHYVAFMLDYAGIGMYVLGSTVMFLEYSSNDDFYHQTKDYFILLGTIFACASFVGCCLSKIIYERPYPFARKLWQIIPIGGGYALLISPVVHGLYVCLLHDVCTPTFNSHLSHIIWFTISTLFFTCQFPQSRAPVGSCDHFFHGHQLFHLAIMISILMQLDTVYEDFLVFRSSIDLRTKPTLASAFGPTTFVFCFETIGLFIFFTLARRKTEERY